MEGLKRSLRMVNWRKFAAVGRVGLVCGWKPQPPRGASPAGITDHFFPRLRRGRGCLGGLFRGGWLLRVLGCPGF